MIESERRVSLVKSAQYMQAVHLTRYAQEQARYAAVMEPSMAWDWRMRVAYFRRLLGRV